MDEVFPGRRVGSFVWRVRSGGNDTKGALLSDNHEHVLVYANQGFEFRGEERDESVYGNPDNDPRGEWQNDNLVKAHNAKQRPEAYYSIHNKETDTWYACDPDSVWRFSSLTRPLKKKLQSDPIETIIAEKRVLWPGNDKTVIYSDVTQILNALKNGSAPKQLKIYLELNQLDKAAEKDPKISRLLGYIEPIEQWVGRKIGYGKPRYKRFRSQLLREVIPLSSWLNSVSEVLIEMDEDDEVLSLTVGATGEGTSQVKAILANKDFPYPKPLSLIKGLLSQATKPNDIVLDFFAGSGTTGQAVLELNAEDGGQRRFILCSSTEATTKEPDKNLCRDVCAERLRRVMAGYGGKPGYTVAQGGEFAYLQLDKIESADVAFETTTEHATTLIYMRETAVAPVRLTAQAIQVIAITGDWLTVLCSKITPSTLEALVTLPAVYGMKRLAVFCPRPKALAALLAERGIEANTYSINNALTKGQVRASAMSAAAHQQGTSA